jgi:hypothetical protein
LCFLQSQAKYFIIVVKRLKASVEDSDLHLEFIIHLWVLPIYGLAGLRIHIILPRVRHNKRHRRRLFGMLRVALPHYCNITYQMLTCRTETNGVSRRSAFLSQKHTVATFSLENHKVTESLVEDER